MTRPLNPAIDNLDGGVSLVGTLETWALEDLLLWLNRSCRTGMVRVGVGLQAGVIFIKSGQIYRCEWGRLRGEKALLALMQVRQGVFSLVQRESPEPKANVFVATEQLLLEAAIALDESRRVRAIA